MLFVGWELIENRFRPDEFAKACAAVKPLQTDFEESIKLCEEKSEVCRYFGVLLEKVKLVKNSVAADRKGNWDLYVATIEDSIPVFQAFDCVNYLRYGSYYYEKLNSLEFTDNWLFRRFKLGQWVVQEKEGKFRAVGET